MKIGVIVKWAPIYAAEWIPPFGEALEAHIKAYKNAAVRRASCSAWGLLWQMVSELPEGTGRCEIPEGTGAGRPRTVRFGKNGKPYFEGDPLYFSISHSKEICAAAISDRPVGVDAEACRADYPKTLIERCLSEREKAVFAGGSDRDFTRLWCRKEAIVKLSGEGITGFPDQIETDDGRYHFQEEKVMYGGAAYWVTAACVNSSV